MTDPKALLRKHRAEVLDKARAEAIADEDAQVRIEGQGLVIGAGCAFWIELEGVRILVSYFDDGADEVLLVLDSQVATGH